MLIELMIFSGASHQTVADTIAAIYNISAASKLANKAMDAGIKFDSQDIYLIEDSVNPETLDRAKAMVNFRLEKKNQKKKNREDFWTGVGSVMFIDDTINSLFGKRKKK